MISKKYISELLSDDPHKADKTKTEEDLFNYIIESEINGNYTQVKDFIKRLSQRQHNDFLMYLNTINVNVEKIYLKQPHEEN